MPTMPAGSRFSAGARCRLHSPAPSSPPGFFAGADDEAHRIREEVKYVFLEPPSGAGHIGL